MWAFSGGGCLGKCSCTMLDSEDHRIATGNNQLVTGRWLGPWCGDFASGRPAENGMLWPRIAGTGVCRLREFRSGGLDGPCQKTKGKVIIAWNYNNHPVNRIISNLPPGSFPVFKGSSNYPQLSLSRPRHERTPTRRRRRGDHSQTPEPATTRGGTVYTRRGSRWGMTREKPCLHFSGSWRTRVLRILRRPKKSERPKQTRWQEDGTKRLADRPFSAWFGWSVITKVEQSPLIRFHRWLVLSANFNLTLKAALRRG